MRLGRQYQAGAGIFFMLVLTAAWSPPILHGGEVVDMDPLPLFSGVLRDDTGQPVAGAKITARNVGGPHCGMIKVQSDETTTDEQGHFSLHTGFYPVYISVRSEAGTMVYPHNPYYSGRAIPLPLLRESDHTLVLMRWASVKGIVLDRETGKPVREFRVHFRGFSHAPRSYQSEDGRFAEPRLTPGTHNIGIMAEGYAPSVRHAVSVPPGAEIDIGIVRMTRGPTLTGRVLSAKDGRPLADAMIRFRTHAIVSYPPDELTATTDAEGRFSVLNMPLLALEVYTSIEQPRHRTLTIGNVDMSLARNAVVEAMFFVKDEDERRPPKEAEGPKAVLPSGVTVELVGVSYCPSGGQPWWQPDGLPLADPPYDGNPFDITNTVALDRREMELAFRLGGATFGPSCKAGLRPGETTNVRVSNIGGLLKTRQPVTDIMGVSAVLRSSEQKSLNLSLCIAAGKWHSRAATEAKTTGLGQNAGRRDQFLSIHEIDGETVVAVRHDVKDRQVRVIAIGNDDIEHDVLAHNSKTNGAYDEVQYRFRDLPLADLKAFVFQTRPYESVEFKNISLEPGHKTDVEVVSH